MTKKELKQEFINVFKTIEGQANPLQKFITKVGIIEMIDKSTDENVDIVFNELLESLTTTGVISKQENSEIRIEIETGELPNPEEPTTEPEEPVIDELKTEEPVIDEPVIDEPTIEPTVPEEPTIEPEEPTTELPETEQ
jgi:septal ring-binding cell division protein DamX